jgi:hypothetical protein
MALFTFLKFFKNFALRVFALFCQNLVLFARARSLSGWFAVFVKPFSWTFSARWNFVLEQRRFFHFDTQSTLLRVLVKGFVTIDSIDYIEKHLLTSQNKHTFN